MKRTTLLGTKSIKLFEKNLVNPRKLPRQNVSLFGATEQNGRITAGNGANFKHEGVEDFD